MPTVSKLTLDVEVKGDRLKTLSSQLNDVNQNTKNLDRDSSRTFKNLDRITDGAARKLQNLSTAAAELTEKFEELKLENLTDTGRFKAELQEQLDFFEDFIKKFPELEGIALEERGKLLERKTEEFVQIERQAQIDRLKDSDSFFDNLKAGFLEFAQQVESNGELVSQFFANTLSEMSQNFSDLFFNVITGRFDGLVDIAKQAFEAILRSFLDLVSAIATRQIVISIAGGLGFNTKGASGLDVLGLGKQAAGAVAGIGGIFGGGAAASTAGLAGAAAAPFGLSPLAVSGAVAGGASVTGAGAGAAGILGTVGAAAGIVGGVLAAAGLAFALLGGVFKKTRLDLDFDQFRDEFGKSLGIAAEVQDFLDKELFNNEIFGRSVSRQAGLGLGSKLPDVIREAIEGQITLIQNIINQLPEELAAQLNESLLKTGP